MHSSDRFVPHSMVRSWARRSAIRAALLPASISLSGWSRTGWHSTGPQYSKVHARQRSRKPSARTWECKWVGCAKSKLRRCSFLDRLARPMPPTCPAKPASSMAIRSKSTARAALDWPQYSKGKYAAAQRDAEHAGRGIWAGSYVEPWLYRACIRANGGPATCSDDANAHP